MWLYTKIEVENVKKIIIPSLAEDGFELEYIEYVKCEVFW